MSFYKIHIVEDLYAMSHGDVGEYARTSDVACQRLAESTVSVGDNFCQSD